ncbi:MAG: type II secretion system F family protein [Phycisphaerae bacterium]
MTISILAVDLEFFAQRWFDLAMSAGVFAAGFLLILSVFNQPGQAKLSPQRAAAIATGHSDRATVFEHTASRPVMWLLLRISHSVNLPRVKGWLARRIVAAGNPNYYTADEYLALSMLGGLILGGLLEICHMMIRQQFSAGILVAGWMVGVAVVIYSLHDKAEKRLTAIARRLPYALDLISLAMGAGASFAEALRTIVREDRQDPLNEEFNALLAEMELGTTRRLALENLADRIPIESIRSLIAAVVQAEELGTPLGSVLHDQATLLRLDRSVRAENLAARASVRILVPCLLLVMAVILVVFGPMIIQIAREGLF